MNDLSRRSFVELTVGSIMSLPVLAGGLVIEPGTALAADATASETDTEVPNYVIIDVVTPWEVGLVVRDVTRVVKTASGGQQNDHIQGKARVTITSRANGKSVSGVTNKNGVVNLDIKALAEDPDGVGANKLTAWNCNGTIRVTCDGYRPFETALMRIEGGGGLIVPLHPGEAGGTYPYRVSFEEWDALYTKNEFLLASGNESDQVFDVVMGVASAKPATLQLWVEGENAPRLSAKAEIDKSTKMAKATFKAPFLKKGSSTALPQDGKLRIAMKQDGITYTWPIALALKDAVIDKPTEKKGITLKPFNTRNADKSTVKPTWPGDAPLVGGGNLSFWTPQLPIDVYINPFGYIQLTLKTPSWGYKGDNGGENPGKWGSYPRKSVSDQFSKMMKTAQAMSDKTSAALSKPGGFQQIDFHRSISFLMNFQLMAAAQWDNDKGLFQGIIGGQFMAALNFTLTENFFAGPIPVLITFALDASFIASLNAACYSTQKEKDESLLDAALDLSRWQWDYMNSGFTMTFNITPSLSVGVGIRGVASISVKGEITLTLFFGVMSSQAERAGHEDLPIPHFTAGWGAKIMLVLHMFLFTKTFMIKNFKFSNFYDNWEGLDKGVKTQSSEGKSLLEAMSTNDLLDQMSIMTNEMLAATAEFQAEGNLTERAVTSQSVGPAADGKGHLKGLVVESGDSAKAGQQAGGLAAATLVTQDDTSGWDENYAQWNEDAMEEAMDDGTAVSYSVVTFHDPTAVVNSFLPEDEPLPEDGLDPDQYAAGEALGHASPFSSFNIFDLFGLNGFKPTTEPPAPDLPDPNVAGLGERGGIRPSSDKILFEKVFGDPRAQIIDITCDFEQAPDARHPKASKRSVHLHAVLCLRIATVDIGDGQMRTRVVMTSIDGDLKGTSRVVEFAMPNPRNANPVLHEPLYDYSFHASATDADGKRRSKWIADSSVTQFDHTNITLAIVSGKRSNGDATSLASVSTDLVFTTMRIPAYLFFNFDRNFDPIESPNHIIRPDLNNFLSMPGSQALGGVSAPFHSISNLQVTDREYDPANPKRYPVCCITFLDRTGNTAAEALDENAQPHFGLLFFEWSTMSALRPDQKAIDLGEVDPSVYEMKLHPKLGDSYTLMLRGSEKVYYWLLKLDLTNGKVQGLARCKDYDPTVRLTPWRGRDCFLTSWTTDESQLNLPPDKRDYTTWTLHKATWSGGAQPELKFEPVGPSSFNIANFTVSSDGNYMYWPQERDESEDRVWAADGTEDVKPRAASYQIIACRLHGERFSDPFVVADLSSDTDVLAVLNTTRGASLEMLRTEFIPSTNADGTPRFVDGAGNPLYNAANIWYTSVPDVLCATAIASEAPNPLVKPGAKATFYVALRNDGNRYLSGCSLTLCGYNESTDRYERAAGATVKLTFSADSIQESSWNPRNADGKLANTEGDYALAPGKTSVYAVKVTIPKDWSGDKKVLFIAHDAIETIEADGLSTQADDEVVKVSYSVEPGEYNVIQNRTAPDSEYENDQVHMDILVIEPPATSDTFTSSHATMTNDDTPGGSGNGSCGSGNGSSGSGGKRGGSNSGLMPKMGDDVFPVGIPIGLAALAAGVLAYESRRSKNEARGDES